MPKDILQLVVGIPAIIHHYHHHEEQGQVSFIDFINDHITDSDHHEKDDLDHEKLPFSHQHTSECNQLLTFVSFSHKLNLKLQVPHSLDIKILTKSFFPDCEFFKSIWQPPKIS
ncbi:hypothetical protein BH11BAC2_BH11BAC2_05470 [soil metagenome]